MLRTLTASTMVAAIIAVPGWFSTVPAAEQVRPNVVVIMVDDMRLDDLAAMPQTRRLLGADWGKGATYDNAYATMPLCCPSRATFLTGQYPHNHGVVDNAAPGGGFGAFDDTDTLPVWMRDAGYQTVGLGKYLNGYGVSDPTYIPPGWDSWAGLVGSLQRWTNYRDFDINANGRIRHIRNSYQTWEFTGRALSQMGKRIPSTDPLFMWVSYLAPHSDVSKRAKRGGYHVWSPAKYARHSTVGKPGSPAFNETYVNDKPGWIKTTPRLTKAEVADTVQARRERRDALRAVDDSVAKLVARLKALGELADTLILFTSDNGYMLGEHRLTLRKRFPYEESISVPLLARGPRIVPGHHPEPVANVDLAATIADVAGSPGPTTHPLEGLSLLGRVPASRPILVESPRGYGRMPAYAGVRTRDWIYVEYRTTRELYNMRVDPWQRLNRIAAPTLNATKRNLKALLASLRDCVGVECAP